jgi:NAD(P)-dependent dehydrogenase (short-subunit alcohol dehydrogenase family)
MRTALITGANRGIGLAIGTGLARQEGIKVVLGCRDVMEGQKAAARIQGQVAAVGLDLSNRAELKRQYAAFAAQHGDPDILVNNAGVLIEGELLTVDEADFEASLRTNFLGPFDLLRLAVPAMRARRYGRIVNVSSGWGSLSEGLGGPAAYSVSKAALNALTVSLANDLPTNVKINSMCPGWVRTRMGGPNASRSPEEAADTAIWLATLPADGPNGGFFRDRKPAVW